jgi:hypothetical protein
MLPGGLYSQTFRTSKPPINGTIEVKKPIEFAVGDPVPGVEIESDSCYVYASGKGMVTLVLKDVEDQYTIIIQYSDYTWAYNGLDLSYVKSKQEVSTDKVIAKVRLDEDKKKFSFNVQIYKDKKLLSNQEALKVLHAVHSAGASLQLIPQ